MAEFRTVPTYTQQLTTKDGGTSAPWYRLLQGLHLGTPPAAESPIAVGASPFSYTAPAGGVVYVSAGTVSAISFTRSKTSPTGQTGGSFPMGQGDVLTLTFSAPPAMVFVPT